MSKNPESLVVTISRQQVPARGVLRYRGAWCFQYHLNGEMRGYWTLAKARKAARERFPGCKITEEWRQNA